jgi:hypothetical protein
VNLKVFRSYDGGITFEANATNAFAYTPPAPGGQTWTTNGNIELKGVTHLAFSIDNNSASYLTNLNLRLNLKSVKYATVNAAK